ncbi:MAG: pilus assembly protein PilM [Planctomycetota bacterium]
MISWKLKTRTLLPIGLDIGHNSVKMIQLVRNGGRISVLAADKVRVDPTMDGDGEERRSFVISAIKQMLAKGSFHGRNVVSCLPNGRLKITSLRLPEAEEEKIEQALRKEVAQRFGLDPDKDAINYVLAGNVRQGDEIKNELILFAADDETIKNHIGMLEEAQLRPVGIDTIPCALFRSFERSLRRQEDREQTVVFVDVGSQFTTVVFGRGGEISFVKQIPIGGEKFNREIAARLGISINEAETLRDRLRMERLANAERGLWAPTPGAAEQDSRFHIPASAQTSLPLQKQGQGGQNGVGLDASTRQVMVDAVGVVAEELAREISLCFRYYTVTFRGKRVERAVFAGGEAYENILLNVLKRQLTVEIEVAQPLKGFDMMNIDFDNDRRGLLCEWAVAVGLSLKGWDGDN